MTAPWRGALGARSLACRSRSVALARAAGSSLSSRGRFGAGPSENLLCRLGFPRALAAGDLASREKPLLLPRGGPRGGGEKPLFLCIFFVLFTLEGALRPTTAQRFPTGRAQLVAGLSQAEDVANGRSRYV